MRIMSALAGVVLLTGLAAGPAAAAAGDGERIRSYDVRLEVRPDGSLRVTETIDYDFGATPRRGIERDIDTEQRFDGSRDRRYPVSDVEVSSSTAPDQVQVTDSGDGTTVRIGDPDRTVTGRHTYRIGYTVAAATTRFAGHDELHWNAVGSGWRVPVGDVRVRVGGAEVTRATCFAGAPGATAPCDSAVASGRFAQAALAPGEALTVVTAFPAGSVAAAAPVLVERRTARTFLAGSPLYALPLAALFLGGPGWLLVTGIRRKRAQEAPALAYRQGFAPQPPPGLRPALAGMLLSGSARPVDAVSVLLDLSARGHVSITPLAGRDWRLVAVRPPDASLPPEARAVLRAVFARGPDTTLKAAGRALLGVRGELRTIARDEVVRLGWFSRPPQEATGPAALGAAMLFLAVPVTLLLGFLADAGVAGIALGAGGIVLVAHAFTRPRPRTAAGEIARSQLIAFKAHLSRIDPMGLPAGHREAALAGLLPFAVVLGLAPQLAGAFSAAGVVAGGYAANPAWWSTFATDATRAATPSSSSGGSSGFSGGSAGGGGGGGGGGSW